MENTVTSPVLVIKNYFILTKPGIIFGNMVTAIGGFALASGSHLDIRLFACMLLGVGLIIASACAFNNYIDIDIDRKMQRTKNRVLVKGYISEKNALAFASLLGMTGLFVLTFFVNFLTTAVTFFGFFVYVALYSFLKYQTVHGTLIGSIAGAVPPVAGYCAVTNQLDLCAFILFVMIATWQMPHFFAIAIYRMGDYEAAAIPVLPIKKGIFITKIQMLVYTVLFVVASVLLSFLGYAGKVYLTGILFFGIVWIGISLQGFKTNNDKSWARKMFIFSLVIVMALSCMVSVNLG